MSLKLILIDRNGSQKETVLQNFQEENLYKKAGFKSPKDFLLRTTYVLPPTPTEEKIEILVYAKKTGKAGQENKYEFPPPIDNDLFFGSCIVLKKKDDIHTNLSLAEWKEYYNILYGGFDDLEDGEANEEEEAEERRIEEEEKKAAKSGKLSKDGYLLDDFIVEDDDIEDDDDSEDDDEEDEEDEISQAPRVVQKKIKINTPVREEVAVANEMGKEVEDSSSRKRKKPSLKEKTAIPASPKPASRPSKKAAATAKKAAEEKPTPEAYFANCEAELQEEEYVLDVL